MADFPAADPPSAQLCAERVRSCDVYVGVLSTRYGSPVRDRPEVSYTELEFDTATDARLVFMLDTRAGGTGPGTPGPVVAGEISQEPVGFQPRCALTARTGHQTAPRTP